VPLPRKLLLWNVARPLTSCLAEYGMLWVRSKACIAGRKEQNKTKQENIRKILFMVLQMWIIKAQQGTKLPRKAERQEHLWRTVQ